MTSLTVEQMAWDNCINQFQPKQPDPYINDPVGWVKDKLGEHLWAKQREIAESLRDNRYTAVQSCHDAGKCVYSESMILLADGRLARAADLIGTTFSVLAFAPDGAQVVSTAWATDNGTKPVFRVRTTQGREVTRTGNHPLFLGNRTGGGSGLRSVVKSVGWTAVDQIKPGDLVLVPEHLDMPQHTAALSDDQIKFLGYLLGDGGTTHFVGFTQQPGAVMDEFCEIAVRMGGKLETALTNRYGVIVRGTAGRTGRAGTNPVLNFVREHGLFGVRAKEKHLPDAAWQMSDRQLALLLNRLFACDGYAYVRSDRGAARAQIGITLASERMIRDIELAALRLGVTGQTRKRSIKLNGKTFDAWEWTLNRAEDQIRFAEVVGMFGKEDALARVIAVARSAGRVSKWMHREAPQGYRWETVAEVEAMGEEPTVTISVEEHHTFLTTFVEHNSFVASRLVSWWLSVHEEGEAFAVTTAPTAAQVSAILWREIRRAHRKGKLDGYITSGAVPEWKIEGCEPIGYGRKPADEDQAAFQGIHSLFPLIVVDEACGVPRTLFDAVDALATNENARVLAIGNPDSSTTHFAKICQPGSGWNVIRIDGLETPNFTAEAIAEHPALAELFDELGLSPSTESVPDGLRPLLLSPMWVEERIHRWGVASPLFTAKVRGMFPEVGDDVLIDPAWIRAARARTCDPAPWSILGVDVARYGSDRSILCIRRGPVGRIIGDRVKQATTATTGHVIAATREHGVDEIRVDGVGVGGGVVDQLVEQRYEVVDMQSGGAPADSKRFLNARAEWYWTLREMFEHDEIDIDEADDELAAQLGSLRFAYTSKGQIKIESKDDMRKRGLPSPDKADSLMLTAPEGLLVQDENVADPEAENFQISRY